MSWPGLLIRILIVAWLVLVFSINRMGLNVLGIEPTLFARMAWNVVLIGPAVPLLSVLAKRVDRGTSEKWKIWG